MNALHQASAALTDPLRVQGVEVRAGSMKILQGIDLVLHPGEVCGLIGPSGAGKSTLIKVLLGLRKPSTGTVSLWKGPAGAMGAVGPVGYVPQDDALHRSLRVRAALDYAARLRLPQLQPGERAARIEKVCAQAGLSDRADLRIGRLSGGQRKRVSVAMELLTEPPLLVLDEPTSGLDPGMEAKMMALFQELARGGRIVLVATHAMQSLDRCDALLVLLAGRVAFFGPPADALRHFEAGSYSAIFDKLPAHAPPVWSGRWLTSPLRSRFLARPAPTRQQGAS